MDTIDGVPMNDAALHLFRLQVGRLWIALYHAAVRTAMSHGIECIGSLLTGYILFASIILILCAAWALLPKVRAGCGKSARPDPRRGSWATVIKHLVK